MPTSVIITSPGAGATARDAVGVVRGRAGDVGDVAEPFGKGIVSACAGGVAEIAVALSLRDGSERWASCFGGLTVVGGTACTTTARRV